VQRAKVLTCVSSTPWAPRGSEAVIAVSQHIISDAQRTCSTISMKGQGVAYLPLAGRVLTCFPTRSIKKISRGFCVTNGPEAGETVVEDPARRHDLCVCGPARACFETS